MQRRLLFLTTSLVAITAAALGLGAFWPTLTKSEPDPMPTARVVVLGNSVIESDRTDRTTPAEAAFTLQNTGPTDVAIHGAESSCSCSVVALDRERLRPGETMVVRLKVTSFDAQSPRYSQAVRIRTDAGNVNLEIRGRLPESRKVLYRPVELVLRKARDRAEWLDNSREVVIRVPSHCCGPDFGTAACQSYLPNLVFEVERTANTDKDVREFRVKVVTRAGTSCNTVANSPHITLTTGCDLVVIPIKFDDQ